MTSSSTRGVATLVYRIVHVDNLSTFAREGGLHAPSRTKVESRFYRAIHDEGIRRRRGQKSVPCGPGGTISDYVAFYLGRRSPMLYRISKGEVAGYDEGQRPVVYLVSSVEKLQEHSARFVFTDGHSLAAVTRWFDDPARLTELPWPDIDARFWFDTSADNDRCRRKQAELLVHRFVPWTCLIGIAVHDDVMRALVRERLEGEDVWVPPVRARPGWYY